MKLPYSVQITGPSSTALIRQRVNLGPSACKVCDHYSKDGDCLLERSEKLILLELKVVIKIRQLASTRQVQDVYQNIVKDSYSIC